MTITARQIYNEADLVTQSSKLQRAAFCDWREKRKKDNVTDALSFDYETTGLTFGVPSMLYINDTTQIKVNNITPFGISLAMCLDDNMMLLWGRAGTTLFDEIHDLLECKGPKVAHNAKYDMRVARVNGYRIQGPIDCTLTMARIHWDRRKTFGLKGLTKIVAPSFEGYDDALKRILTNIKTSYTRSGKPKGYANYSFIPDEICSEYAMIDAFITWLLNVRLRSDIDATQPKVYLRERRIIPIIIRVEERGLQFDRRACRAEIAKVSKRIPRIQSRLIRLAGREFNPNSPKQLLPLIIELGMPKKLLRKPGKEHKYTTEKETLEKAVNTLDDKKIRRFVDTLFKLRKCNKLLGTYLQPLYDKSKYNKGIVYCNINPTDTKNGRMSSSDPNLQNIPRTQDKEEDEKNPVRHCFICRPGYINYYPDYSQMEMWLFAIIAGETNMLNTLMSGGDIHAQTAIDVLGDEALDNNGVIIKTKRQDFKKVNFGIIYGMGFGTLAVTLKKTRMEAFDIRKAYLDTYPRILEFLSECKVMLATQGYVVDMFGRRYHLAVRDAYQAINALVQGACAQILKIAIIEIDKYFKPKPTYMHKSINMILPIHDEIQYEMPRDYPLATQIIRGVEKRMECVPQLMKRGIRLQVETKHSTKSWEDKIGLP